MSVPSSLLEASCLRDLEHNCSEEMIIMIMIMMTRKKMRSRLSFPNHEQKTTAFPLAGRHLLEVENCKIASFSMVFLSPPNCVYSHWHNLSPTGWMECIYWWDAPKNLSSISVSFFTFTFLMTGDNYQANVVDKTDHMWQTIFILISGGWGGHHGWKLRVSFSLSLSRWPEIMTKDNGYSIFFHG